MAAGTILMRGVVQSLRGETVRALLEYGAASERMLCDLPRKWWPDSSPPKPEQQFDLSWSANGSEPSLEVMSGTLPGTRPRRDNTVLRAAGALLGIYPGDKVLVVLGPIPKPKNVEQARWWLFNAGWGEALSLTRLPYLFSALGVEPEDTEYAICEARVNGFQPEAYADRHIVFLGSILSNIILRDLYWPRWDSLKGFGFHKENEPLAKIEVGGLVFANKDNLADRPAPDWRSMEVEDHFLLARVPNPYSSDSRFRCILSCGAGTIGTGFGVVAFTAAPSVMRLLDHTDGKDFEMVGRVNMVGFFNPKSDPVTLEWIGGKKIEEPLLAGALESPIAWDRRQAYYEYERDADDELRKSILARYQK